MRHFDLNHFVRLAHGRGINAIALVFWYDSMSNANDSLRVLWLIDLEMWTRMAWSWTVDASHLNCSRVLNGCPVTIYRCRICVGFCHFFPCWRSIWGWGRQCQFGCMSVLTRPMDYFWHPAKERGMKRKMIDNVSLFHGFIEMNYNNNKNIRMQGKTASHRNM